MAKCRNTGIKHRIKASSVFQRLWDTIRSGSRVIVMEGSARSTKTYSIIQALILLAIQSPVRMDITIARAKLTWLKGTILKDFFTIIESQFPHLYNPDNYNKTECTYRIGNTLFTFLGLDEAQKLHGRKQDYFWINEAVEADYKDYEQLILRTSKLGILDYNPSAEEHWIYNKACNRSDATLIHSTYKDNPFLELAIRQEIERLEPTEENIKAGTADEVSWKIYGLGLRASPKGLIYPNFTLVKELPPFDVCKKKFYGLDFGFTNDPTTLIDIRQAHGELWFDELVYERGLVNCHNERLPDRRSIEKELGRCGLLHGSDAIWADSAEPKSIQEIYDCGFNIHPVDKGQDSIINGIDIVKRYKINVTERSLNLLKELRNYKWAVDKEGKTLNKPIDAFNHALDAVRYGCFMELPKDTDFFIQTIGASDFDRRGRV